MHGTCGAIYSHDPRYGIFRSGSGSTRYVRRVNAWNGTWDVVLLVAGTCGEHRAAAWPAGAEAEDVGDGSVRASKVGARGR